MNLTDIQQHWTDWAKTYGTQLRATTKGETAKLLEIDALKRAITPIAAAAKRPLKILEMGCGNGKNCLELAQHFSSAHFTGIDLIPEMITAARQSQQEQDISTDRLRFAEGNVLDFIQAQYYDLVFTDRCLINLNTDALQHQAMAQLVRSLAPQGHLIMIENSQTTYAQQNALRQAVRLDPRTPAEFNHFFNEQALLEFLPTLGLQHIRTEDFIGLHDVILYVLLPLLNGGKIEYDHPLIAAATQINLAANAITPNALGSFGQNRLYHWQLM